MLQFGRRGAAAVVRGDTRSSQQYLRMVGRQQRPLCHVELTALTTWLATPAHYLPGGSSVFLRTQF
jgi:hypothetical protein